MDERRAAALRDLDELVGYGVIEYTLTERKGRDPHVEIRPGRAFRLGVPLQASPRALRLFTALASGRLQQLVDSGGAEPGGARVVCEREL